MRNLLIYLYPRAWRKRYAEELEALIQDAPASWQNDIDLFTGAIKMRLRWNVGLPLITALVIAGTLAGLAASYMIAQM